MLWSNIKSLQTIHLRKVYSLFGGIQTLKEWPFFNINIRLVARASSFLPSRILPMSNPAQWTCPRPVDDHVGVDVDHVDDHAQGLWMTMWMWMWMWTMWTTMPRACGWPSIWRQRVIIQRKCVSLKMDQTILCSMGQKTSLMVVIDVKLWNIIFFLACRMEFPASTC